MALTVTNANPGSLSGTGNATSGSISGSGDAPGYNYTAGGTNGVVGTFSPDAGGVLGASTSVSNGGYAAADPNASARNQFLSELPTALQNIRLNAGDAFDSGYRTLQGQGDSLINSLNVGQKGINTARENVELNRLNGMRDILSFVRNGLQSAGSRLAANNAVDSSGAEAFNRVYSAAGNDRARGIGNQAFLQNREINSKQEALDLQKSQGQTDFTRKRDELVAGITTQIRNQLMALDQQAAGLDLPGRIAVDQEKQALVNAGVERLNQVDQWMRSAVGGINPADQQTIANNAAQLQNAGTQMVNPFSLNLPIGPTSMTPNGPSLTQLPIAVPKTRQDM